MLVIRADGSMELEFKDILKVLRFGAELLVYNYKKNDEGDGRGHALIKKGKWYPYNMYHYKRESPVDYINVSLRGWDSIDQILRISDFEGYHPLIELIPEEFYDNGAK
ncbi:MAG: hypothetical protein ACTSRA_00785 [Promethearchaeota archaeon]|nr:MAG: hypothetical protein [Helarchaeota virus Nidhogg Meg22_1012]URC17316.1 MAG: hypothetical protein [Helarchaeota virus Nidhogg Meg22_1214]